MSITEQVLSQEGYVEMSPAQKDTPQYRIAYLVKEEIRRHAWLENEKGRGLTWTQAKQEWMHDHYADFLEWMKPFRPKKKTLLSTLVNKQYSRRKPMITGGVV